MWSILLSLARPPLACSRRSACLNCSPAPGRGRRRREDGLRLRAVRRFACLSSYRAALSLPLVRYCRSVRHAGTCCLAILPVPCRHLSSCAPASFDVFKAFQSLRGSIQSSIDCVRRCHAIQSHRVHPLSACLFRHLPRRPVPRLRADDVMRFCVPLSSSISGPLPVSPFSPSARRTGRNRGMCGELD